MHTSATFLTHRLPSARIIRRVAVLTTELERLEVKFATAGEASADDIDLYARVAANLRRLLEAVGLRRRPRDVSPTLVDIQREYLGEGAAMSGPLAIDKVLQDTRLLGAALTPTATWQTWTLRSRPPLRCRSPTRSATSSAHCWGPRLPKQSACVSCGRWSVVAAAKARMAAALACYFALFVKHKLSSGERGMVLVLAATTEQAKVVFDYALGVLAHIGCARERN